MKVRTVGYCEVEAQAAAVEARAKAIGGESVRCFVEEVDRESGSPSDSRPVYRALLADLQEGDHLVVPDLTALSAVYRGLIGAVQQLARRGVHIHTVEQVGNPALDFDPAGLEVLAQVWQLRDDVFKTYVQTATRKALAAKRNAGQACTPRVAIGKDRVMVKEGAFDVWIPQQCDLVREIVRRKDSGETFKSIAQDFNKRRVRKVNGKLWARLGARGRRGPLTDSIRRAYKTYSATLNKDPILEGIVDLG